jgi:hypothetical protein
MQLAHFIGLLALIGAVFAVPARAETPAELLTAFGLDARQSDAAFKGFSTQRGQQLFQQTHGGEWSCASCHTDTPSASGKHAKTGKAIAPLAPAVNPDRFTSSAKVEKWFRRNCNDVLGRACTSQEKGDVLSWLLSIKN